MTQGPPADLKLQRTSRDAATVPGLLEGWLAGALPLRWSVRLESFPAFFSTNHSPSSVTIARPAES